MTKMTVYRPGEVLPPQRQEIMNAQPLSALRALVERARLVRGIENVGLQTRYISATEGMWQALARHEMSKLDYRTTAEICGDPEVFELIVETKKDTIRTGRQQAETALNDAKSREKVRSYERDREETKAKGKRDKTKAKYGEQPQQQVAQQFTPQALPAPANQVTTEAIKDAELVKMRADALREAALARDELYKAKGGEDISDADRDEIEALYSDAQRQIKERYG